MKMRIRSSGSVTLSSRVFEPLKNSGEGMLLNQVQQALFGLEVVIEPGQRHAGGARKVAHGCAFVPLDAKHLGGMGENLREAAVETGHRGLGQRVVATAGGAGCG